MFYCIDLECSLLDLQEGLKSTILMSGYQPEALLTEIQVLGLAHRPATVTMLNQDNQHLQYSYNQDTKVSIQTG